MAAGECGQPSYPGQARIPPRVGRSWIDFGIPAGVLAFPILAGAGTLTTIISLKAQHDNLDIGAGIILNLLVIFIVLRSSNWIAKKIGAKGVSTLRQVFGIILIAIAFEMFRSNWG